MLMLPTVWLGLKVRGQSLDYLGLSIGRPALPAVRRVLAQSMVVFLGATAAFVVGAILMANIVGIPEGPDMSSYNYLSGNLPMLIVALLQL